MAAVENDEISSVVVYSFSRFARSTTHLLQALQLFKKKGEKLAEAGLLGKSKTG